MGSVASISRMEVLKLQSESRWLATPKRGLSKLRLIGSCAIDPFQVGISRRALVLKFPFGVPDVVSLDL